MGTRTVSHRPPVESPPELTDRMGVVPVPPGTVSFRSHPLLSSPVTYTDPVSFRLQKCRTAVEGGTTRK